MILCLDCYHAHPVPEADERKICRANATDSMVPSAKQNHPSYTLIFSSVPFPRPHTTLKPHLGLVDLPIASKLRQPCQAQSHAALTQDFQEVGPKSCLQ